MSSSLYKGVASSAIGSLVVGGVLVAYRVDTCEIPLFRLLYDIDPCFFSGIRSSESTEDSRTTDFAPTDAFVRVGFPCPSFLTRVDFPLDFVVQYGRGEGVTGRGVSGRRSSITSSKQTQTWIIPLPDRGKEASSTSLNIVRLCAAVVEILTGPSLVSTRVARN